MVLFGNTSLQLNSFNRPIIIRKESEMIDIINSWNKGFESMVYLYLGSNFKHTDTIEGKQINYIDTFLYEWYDPALLDENSILKNYLYYFNGAQWMRIKVSNFDYENPVVETITVKDQINVIKEIKGEDGNEWTNEFVNHEIADIGRTISKTPTTRNLLSPMYSRQNYKSIGYNGVNNVPYLTGTNSLLYYCIQVTADNRLIERTPLNSSGLLGDTIDFDSRCTSFYIQIIGEIHKELRTDKAVDPIHSFCLYLYGDISNVLNIRGASREKIDLGSFSANTINSDNGNITSSAALIHTDYIEIDSSKKFIQFYAPVLTKNYNFGIAFYRQNGSDYDFIKGIPFFKALNIFNPTTAIPHYTIQTEAIPANATHVRLSYWNNERQISYSCPIFQAYLVSDYDRSIEEYFKLCLQKEITKIIGKEVENLNLTDGWIDNTGVANNDGVKESEFIKTDFFSVEGYQYLKYIAPKTLFQHNIGLAFYDSSRAFIGGDNSFIPMSKKLDIKDNEYEYQTIKIPETASYARLTYWKERHIRKYGDYIPPLKVFLLNINDSKEIKDLSLTNGYLIYSGGSVGTVHEDTINNRFAVTDFIRVEGYQYLKYVVPKTRTPQTSIASAYFYNASQNVLEGTGIQMEQKSYSRDNNYEYKIIEIPPDASYARFTYWKDSYRSDIDLSTTQTPSLEITLFKTNSQKLISNDYFESFTQQLDNRIDNLNNKIFGDILNTKYDLVKLEYTLKNGGIRALPDDDTDSASFKFGQVINVENTETQVQTVRDAGAAAESWYSYTNYIDVTDCSYIIYTAPYTVNAKMYGLVFSSSQSWRTSIPIGIQNPSKYPSGGTSYDSDEKLYRILIQKVPAINGKIYARFTYWNPTIIKTEVTPSGTQTGYLPNFTVWGVKKNNYIPTVEQIKNQTQNLEDKFSGEKEELKFELKNGGIAFENYNYATGNDLYMGQVVNNPSGSGSTIDAVKGWANEQLSYTTYIDVTKYSHVIYIASCLQENSTAINRQNYGLVFSDVAKWDYSKNGIQNPVNTSDAYEFCIAEVPQYDTGQTYARFTYWNPTVIKNRLIKDNPNDITDERKCYLPEFQAWGIQKDKENSLSFGNNLNEEQLEKISNKTISQILEPENFGQKTELFFNWGGNGALKAIPSIASSSDSTIYDKYPLNTIFNSSNDPYNTSQITAGYYPGGYDMNNYQYTDYIDVTDYSYLKYITPCTLECYLIGAIFYYQPIIEIGTSNITPLMGVEFPIKMKSTDKDYIEKIIEVPKKANYKTLIRFTYFSNARKIELSAPDFYVYGLIDIYEQTLFNKLSEEVDRKKTFAPIFDIKINSLPEDSTNDTTTDIDTSTIIKIENSGWKSYYRIQRYIVCDDISYRAKIKLETVGTGKCILGTISEKQDITKTNSSTQYGTIVEFDFDNRVMTFTKAIISGSTYKPNSSSYLEIPMINLEGLNYRIEIGRKKRCLYAAIYNLTTGQVCCYKELKEYESNLSTSNTKAGNLYDFPIFANTSGNIDFQQVSAYVPKATIAILGDSNTEGHQVAQEDVWANKIIKDIFKGDGLNCGRTGGAIQHMIYCAKDILPAVRPKYVIVMIGSNNRLDDYSHGIYITDTEFKTGIQTIKDEIIAIGAIPIFNKIPGNAKNVANTTMNGKITDVANTSPKSILIAIDEETNDRDKTSFRTDYIHLNPKGELKVYNKVISTMGWDSINNIQ